MYKMRHKESWFFICDGKNFGGDDLLYSLCFKSSGGCESKRQQVI